MEAAGLASSIITFIDFSYKLILGTVEVHKKATTGPAADPHISNIINDLEDVTRNMTTLSIGPSAKSPATAQNPSVLQNSSHHEALRKLSIGCNELSKSLVDVLKDLERRPGGNKLWRSFQTSWATLRSSDKIVEMEQKLNTYRLQLLVRLSMMVAEDAASAQSQMDQMRQGNEASFSETITELRLLRDDMKRLDGNLKIQAAQSCQLFSASPDQVKALTDVREELSRITEALDTMRRQSSADLQILARLRFPHVHSRYDAIAHGEFGSFARLLGEVPTSEEIQSPALPTQAAQDARLQEQKAREAIDCWINLGGSVLHISGKPGSGKSTLMKLLGHDTLLGDKLRTWAADNKLVTARFFFWLSGDTLQRSLEGLYRSMLLEVLQQCPELTRHVFPKHWDDMSTREGLSNIDHVPFRLVELQDAMSKLIENFSGGAYRFCFFIDGLDEYAGDSMDHVSLARQLQQWATSTHVKICASSRPYQEFHSVFDENTRVVLHELTGPDVLGYCLQTLKTEGQRHIDADKIENLANGVEVRASGVFLWARLVVRSLCEGILHLDTYDSLMARLDEAPSDLMQLFLHLFNKINPVDRTRAYQLLLLVSWWGSQNAIIVSWIKDLEDMDFPYNKRRVPLNDEEVARRIKYADGQLKLTCRGLLELRRRHRPSIDVYFQQEIDFLHRTVRDFLHEPETVSVMQQHLGKRNLTSSDYMRLAIAEFKFARLPSNPGDLDDSLFWCYYCACKGAKTSSRALEECENILHQLRQESPPAQSTWEQSLTLEYTTNWSRTYMHYPVGRITPDPFRPGMTSHIHLLLYLGASPHLVLSRIMAGAYDSSLSDLCLVSSAIWEGYIGRFELSQLELLLEHNFDFRDRLSLFCKPKPEVPCRFPGWVAFLVLLGTESSTLSLMKSTLARRLQTKHLFAALELLLRRRSRPELDVRMEFYVYDTVLSTWADLDLEQSVTMTLEEVIIRTTPPNTDTLLGEIGARKTWGGWASWALNGVTGLPWSRNEASTLTAVTGFEVLREAFKDVQLPKEYMFAVRKIWVGDAKYDVPGLLGIRLF